MLKRIGLCAGAVLASVALFSVMAASAVAAEQRGFFVAGEKSEEAAKQPRFGGEVYPTSLASTENSTFKFGTQFGTMECPGEFSGKLSSAAAEITLTSFYYFSACHFAGSFEGVTITANGCDNTVNVLNEGPPYVGQFGYKCPAEKSYEFHTGACTIIIPAQAGHSEVTYKNTGTGKTRAVQVAFNVSGLKYSLKGPFPFGPCTGTHENGTFTGSMTLKGSA
ncbi:MAG TPA: hypothetical protein VIM28_08465 [Solirubrobacterales bacterium]